MKKTVLIEQKIYNIIKETVRSVLMEKRGLQSDILYNCIKKYGKPYWYDVDLNAVTDDDILYTSNEDLTDEYGKELKNRFKSNQFISGNGYTIVIKPDKYRDTTYRDKKDLRWNERRKTDGAKEYRWHNKDAEEYIFKNPYFKEWDKESQKKAFDNVKNGRHAKDGFNENKLKEAKDRSEYWKQRWAKQKSDGTVPDRSEYWKARAKKQKEEKQPNIKKEKHNNTRYAPNFNDKYDEFDEVLDLMTDNDWGEYFGDHD